MAPTLPVKQKKMLECMARNLTHVRMHQFVKIIAGRTTHVQDLQNTGRIMGVRLNAGVTVITIATKFDASPNSHVLSLIVNLVQDSIAKSLEGI